MPKSPQVRISTSSSRRTYSTAPTLGSKLRKIEDGIGDQLAGAVKGHVAAAVDLEQLHAALGQKLRRRQHVIELGIAAQRDDRRVLQQQQRVFDAAGLAHLLQGALELQGRAVGDPAKIENVGDHRDVLSTVSLTLDDDTPRFVPTGHNLATVPAVSRCYPEGISPP